MSLRLSESGTEELASSVDYLSKCLIDTNPKLGEKTVRPAVLCGLRSWLFRFGALSTSDIDIEKNGPFISVTFQKNKRPSNVGLIFRQEGNRLVFVRINEASLGQDPEVRKLLRLLALQRLLVRGLIGI